ncbi:hypothetical protein APHAL10511_000313 [Amanita phalloides]|nr:hypothetical protein APHAL10511_000313 [Amanita phalloides]
MNHRLLLAFARGPGRRWPSLRPPSSRPFSSPSSTTTSFYRRPLIVSSFLSVSLLCYALGSVYPPPQLSLLFPQPAPGPPASPDSPASLAYTSNLEQTLQNLPLLQSLRSRPDAEEWYEVRPYTNYPEERSLNSLTAGALRGPGKLALRPLVRAKRDETEAVAVIHVGRGLCGHDGIVHGGLLATLLDETLARTAISNFPEHVGVTANLSINYRAPTRADQFIVIKTKLDSLNGRKAVVSGRIEDLQGTLLVDASATFVQPKYAKFLNSNLITLALGDPATSAANGEKLKVPK